MSPEYAVTFTLKAVEVSGATPDLALTAAAAQISADLPAHVKRVDVERLDRIRVTGLNGKQ